MQASSGLGASAARCLSREGYYVILGECQQKFLWVLLMLSILKVAN